MVGGMGKAKQKAVTGALIFAFNNEETDYVAMAEWSAKRIRKHLGIPVAIVTDSEAATGNRSFDRVIKAVPETGGTRYFEDYEKTVSWHNAGRVDAYSITPWIQTLVLDADYVVNSGDLKSVLASKSDFMCHRKAYDMSTGKPLAELNQFGAHGMPMWWATVMMFRKSNTAQYIFDCMNMVRNNWQHYRDLYGIQKETYRNDFALSIALGIVSGHTGVVDVIPWSLASVMPSTKLYKNELNEFLLEYNDAQQNRKHIMFEGMDFHAMGKRDLGDIVEADRRARLLDSGTKQQGN